MYVCIYGFQKAGRLQGDDDYMQFFLTEFDDQDAIWDDDDDTGMCVCMCMQCFL